MSAILYYCESASIHDLRFVDSLRKTHEVDLLQKEKDNKDNKESSYKALITSPLSVDLHGIKSFAPKRIFLSMGYDLNEHVKDEILKERIAKNLSTADMVVIDNPVLKQPLKEIFNFQRPIYVLPYGCKINEFQDISSPNTNNLGTNRSLSSIHNNSLIINAIHRIEKKKYGTFVFVKHGPKQDEFLRAHKEQLREIKHEVIQGGDEGVTKHFLSRVDLFISASQSDGSSVSLLEAMAARKLCIVSNHQANNYWIEHGVTGFCFDNTVESLVTTLEMVLAMETSDRMTLIENAELKVQQEANWGKNFNTFVVTLGKLISNP